MVRGIWSTGSVTDSRTGTDVRFGGGESPRGREAGQWRGDLGQRTLSRTRGRERMSALGGESPRGENCQRTLSRTRERERTVRFGWGESTREGG